MASSVKYQISPDFHTDALMQGVSALMQGAMLLKEKYVGECSDARVGRKYRREILSGCRRGSDKNGSFWGNGVFLGFIGFFCELLINDWFKLAN